MDLYTLYAAIRDGVAQDPELSAWATTFYQRADRVRRSGRAPHAVHGR